MTSQNPAKKSDESEKTDLSDTAPRQKISGKKTAADILWVIAASLIYSCAIHFFTVPNEIAPGGITGVATVINYLAGIPVGLLYGILNFPIIIIGFIFLGRAMMLKTFLSIAVITAATDYLLAELPVYTGDKMLAAIFGGALLGIALGIIFRRDGTSGGSDVISRIIRRKMPHISMGKILVALDLAVIAVSIAVFKSVESGLYAIISIIVSAKLIDLILYGTLEGKLLLIFSDNYSEIAAKIMSRQERGVTILKGYGGYSGKEKNVICCAVQKNQYAKIKKIVKIADPAAFMVITNAGEVLGEGFSENIIE